MSDAKADEKYRRRTFGCGLYTGLRLAGIEDPEEFMNNARAQSKIDNLTGLARKVYEAVPMSESWDIPKIVKELKRHGHTADFQTVGSSLRLLEDQKLIKEPIRGQFIREKIKESKVVSLPKGAAFSMDLNDPSAQEPVTTVTGEADPLARMAALASELRQYGNALLLAADRLESLAIGAEELSEGLRTKLAQFDQFKALLSSLNGQA